ncbi:MAG: helix-hairpin-helix domain-containing protein, partial [Lachnospiraceae bacterium]|nr:helix-hairpin-helix domain-containing protein [Lachnospiraceae bacterium]
KAEAIIAYREEFGNFTSVEDIMNVSGIKDSSYERIKDFIKV